MSEAVNSVAAEEKKTIVTKKDLLKAWWKWTLAVEVPVSFDRMQALAFGYSMNKVLRKLYKDDPEELQAAMRRHTCSIQTVTGEVSFTVLRFHWRNSVRLAMMIFLRRLFNP